MEIEPLALGLLCVLLFGSGVLSAVLGLGLRRGSYSRGATAADRPPRELVAAEVDRTRGQYEIQLTRVSGERDQALANSRHLQARLTELQGNLETRIAAEVDGRLAAVLEARVEAGVAARLAEALGKAATRFEPRDTAEAQEPPGPQPQSPAVPHQLPLGRDCAADSTVDGADLGPLIVRAASVRGPRQREDGEHRRDAVMLGLVEEMPSPTLLSVVAAGAPRGLWSQSAAQRACRSLASQLGRYGEHLGSVLGPGRYPDPGTGTVPAGHVMGPNEAEDSELGALLRSAVQGVGRSVRLVGLNEGAVRASLPPWPVTRPTPRSRSHSPRFCPSSVTISGVSTWPSASATTACCGSGTVRGRASSPACAKHVFPPTGARCAGPGSRPARRISWPCAARPWRSCCSVRISASGSRAGGWAGVPI